MNLPHNPMGLEHTIIPRSDQINADDLIAGPRTITITSVDVGHGEQPVSIHYEGENGRPYKPGLSMRRVLVALWGKDETQYVGRRLRLFRDPSVSFGKDECGGTRISHMSGINEPATIALTVTRGKRKPYTVLPLKDEPKHAGEPIDTQALIDIGASKAREGMASLGAWWESIGKSARARIGNAQLNTWKLAAQDADEGRKP